jgi:hypothetical protein
MKVKETMTGDTKTCDLNASLAQAAKQMWITTAEFYRY